MVNCYNQDDNDDTMMDDVFETVDDNEVDEAFLLYDVPLHKQIEVSLVHSNREIKNIEELRKYFIWKPTDTINSGSDNSMGSDFI